MSMDYTLRVLRIQNVVWELKFHRKTPNLYVEVKLGDITKKTQTIKNNLSPDWNEMLTLSSPDASSILHIRVRHDASVWKDPCIGYIDIPLDDLLGKCALGEAQLSIKALHKKASTVPTGVLYLRLEVTSGMASVATDIEAAGQAVQRSGIIRSAKASGSAPIATIEAAGQLSEQAGLYKSIGNLFSKLEVFVTVIDDLSQVHPYLNVAWQVTSALYKGISNQFKADKRIVDLMRAVEEAFYFVRDTDSLANKAPSFEQAVIRLLKQTTEICLFVKQYTGHGFVRRMIDLSSCQKIDDFEQSLVTLKRALDSNTALHTAFVSARVSDKVDAIYLQNRLNPVQTDGSFRPQCLLGTRVQNRKQIMDWILSDTSQNVLWLHGVAGCGKSTVSTTIAEYFRGISRLGAFLFFERGKSEPASVIRTVAYKLASFDSSIAKHVVAAIERDNDIATASAATQFEKLLLEPLAATTDAMQGPVLIVLDALDECGAAESRRNLMQLLHRELPKLPKNFRFLITSRREVDINKAFSSQPDFVVSVELDYTSETSQNDVLSYIHTEMLRIVKEEEVDVPDGWPWDPNMQLLAKAADGLFIWGSTAVKLVSSYRDDPFQKLQDLVSDSRSLTRFGLKELYATVLRSSGILWTDNKSKARFAKVFGLILLSKVPLSIAAIDGMLDFPSSSSSRHILSNLQCLLAFAQDAPIRLFHASFADFLMSPEQSEDPWFIDIPAYKSFLTTRCFGVMKDLLQFNICEIENSYMLNDRIPELQGRIEKKIPPYLAYACLFWSQHLREAIYSPTLLDELSDFLYTRLLLWLEVLSLLKKVNRAGPACLDSISWTGTHSAEILEFLRDARRLVTLFSSPISQATPHIYLSVLPLSSKESKVATHYSKHTPLLVHVDRKGLQRQSPLLKQIQGHAGTVWSVAFSPDGTRVVSGSHDKTIRIWDAESGEAVSGPFEGHSSAVSSVAFSRDGTRVVSGSLGPLDKTIRIWDAESGEAVSDPFEGHTGAVRSVAFSPDGARIVSGSYDNTIRIWDAESGETVSGPFEGHTGAVRSVAFSPDGTRIVSGSEDETVRIWDAESGEAVSGPFEGHTGAVRSVAFSPDGARIVSGSYDKTIRIWDAESGETVSGPFKGHSCVVWSVAFSPDGTRVVSGSEDETIRVWNAKNGEAVSGPFEGHSGIVSSVAFSPDGTRVVSGSLDKTIRIWDAESGEVVSGSFKGYSGIVSSVAFSPDGTRVVSGSHDKTIRIWDAESGEAVSGPFEGHTDIVTSVAFSPNGARIVSGSHDDTIRIWDAESGETVSGPFEGHSSIVSSVAFSPDGTRVVSGSEDETVRIWDAESGEAVSGPFEGHPSAVWSVAFSPDGTQIVSGSHDKTIRIWDAESGETVSGPFIGHTGAVRSVAFSPDGARIVSGSYDNTIRIWDAESGETVSGPFEGHSGIVSSVAFSPDGTRIVSGSEDKTIRIWDAESGETVSGALEADSEVGYQVASNWRLAEDGWILGENHRLLLWVPLDLRPTLWRPRDTAILGCAFITRLDFSNSVHGKRWHECFT